MTALFGPAHKSAGMAFNDKGQILTSDGMLYSDGTIKSLLSLLPPNTGLSNLGFGGINDAGQIIGQGLIDGQERAFLLSPDVITPEPGASAVWAVLGIAAVFSSRIIRN